MTMSPVTQERSVVTVARARDHAPSRFLDLVQTDRINTRIYQDPEVFQEELTRIFHRCWVYVAHETEIPSPGDFKTTTLGLQPVIVIRSVDGAIGVFFNRCRHRASLMCDVPYGSATYLKCPYHGWTYRASGELVAVPKKQDFGPTFDMGDFGLMRVARVESYRGFIFASMADEGPSLLEHLGNATPWLDRVVDQGAGITLSAGVHRNVYPGNWKLQQDNTVDNYHAGVVHEVYVKMTENRIGRHVDLNATVPEWRSIDLGNGHAVLDFASGTGLGLQAEGPTCNLEIFPNLNFVGVQVRVTVPVAVDSTVVEMYPTSKIGADDDENGRRMKAHLDFFGPAGFGSPDDNEVVFRKATIGMQATVGDPWILLMKGLHHERVESDGTRTGDISDETANRAIYRGWREWMST